MSSPCNIFNVNQIKVTDLVRYSTLRTKDLILTIESGSSNDFYSRKSTFGDVVNFFSNITSSYTGSFSGSINATGKLTGSLLGTFKGKGSGSFTGSFKGLHTGFAYCTGSFTGSFKGSTKGVMSGSYTGKILSNNALITGSLSGSYTGKIITKNIVATGSLSGSIRGNILTKNLIATGSLSGSYRGTLFSRNANIKGLLTGSFSGSIKGFISASANLNSTGKVAFYGTSSWALSASNAITAGYSTGNPNGSGTTDYYTIWTDTDTLTGNAGGSDILNSAGNVKFEKPINLPTSFKASIFLVSSSYNNSVNIGTQPFKTYFRTNITNGYSNGFAMYCGGTNSNSVASPFLEPGHSGSTIMCTLYDNLGVGNFDTLENINSLFHIHLTGSKYTYPRNNWINPSTTVVSRLNNALKNPFRITSGSNPAVSTTVGGILLNLSSSGQLDVKGDIVAFSTYGSSDARLKHEVKTIENAVDSIEKLRPVSFIWNQTSKQDYGLIAQEVEKLYPDLVKEDLSGFKVVKYNSLIAFLIKSIQELKKEIEEIKLKNK